MVVILPFPRPCLRLFERDSSNKAWRLPKRGSLRLLEDIHISQAIIAAVTNPPHSVHKRSVDSPGEDEMACNLLQRDGKVSFSRSRGMYLARSMTYYVRVRQTPGRPCGQPRTRLDCRHAPRKSSCEELEAKQA